MRKPSGGAECPGGIRLLDSAFALLRRAPAGAFASYYAGAVPFVLCALYFVADMSRAADARLRAADSAFMLAVAFVWMKSWQAVFAVRLRSVLAGAPPPRWKASEVAGIVARQCAIQPTGLVVLPIALLMTLPFPAAFAFYQGVLALPPHAVRGNAAAVRRAMRFSNMWPMQNFVFQSVALLFALVIWVNLMAAAAILPHLLRMFTGIETDLSRSLGAVLNTTVLSATLLGAYICGDPVVKAAYVIRCFRGESLTTGEDLRSELRTLGRVAAVAAAVLFVLLVPGGSRAAQSDVPPLPAAAVQTADLDQAISRALEHPIYRWRLPRDAHPPEEEKAVLARFLETLVSFTVWLVKEAVRIANRVAEWIDSMMPERRLGRGGGGRISFTDVLHPLLFALLAVLAASVGVLAYRLIRNRRQAVTAASALPVAALPDISDETVSAAQLPEDEWLAMAHELIGKGEFRLGLRALYLATLAHLSGRELIRLARHKSNLEYSRELRRRALAMGSLVPAFETNVRMFEGAWYGLHAVSEDDIVAFEGNLDCIRGSHGQ